jgi:hypothetical protein
MLLDRNDCEEPHMPLLRVTYKFMPRHNDVSRCQRANFGTPRPGFDRVFSLCTFQLGWRVSTSCAGRGDSAKI